MSAVCLHASATRKPPKSLESSSDGIYAAANAPETDSATAGIIIRSEPCVFKRPLPECILRLISDIGRKAMRLAACAACCSMRWLPVLSAL